MFQPFVDETLKLLYSALLYTDNGSKLLLEVPSSTRAIQGTALHSSQLVETYLRLAVSRLAQASSQSVQDVLFYAFIARLDRRYRIQTIHRVLVYRRRRIIRASAEFSPGPLH